MKRNIIIVFLALAMVTFIKPFSKTVFASKGTDTIISVNTPIVDNLNDYSEVDTFRFSLSQPGSLQIKLEYDIKGDYTVTIYEVNSHNNLVSIQSQSYYSNAASTTGRYTQKGNKIRVAAGDYYIKVSRTTYGDFNNNDYILTAAYDAELGNNFEKEPNNDAKLSTLISPNAPCTGNLNDISDVDYFLVQLPAPGSLQIKLEYDIKGDYTVTIYEVDPLNNLASIQNQSYYSNAASTTGRYTQKGNKIRVAAGDYYIKVNRTTYGDFNNNDYILTAAYDAEPGNNFEKEPNNDAKLSTLISPNAPCTGNLNDSSDVDYFLVKLPVPGSLQVELEYDIKGDYNVAIYEVNSLNNLVSIQNQSYYSNAASTTGRYSQKGNKIRVAAGDYYFKVNRTTYGDFSNNNYVLTILSDVKIIAKPNKSTVLVNGFNIAFDAYTINNNNYFKLRDLAQAVNGTAKNFDVVWDGAKNAINLVSNKPYTAVGNELEISSKPTNKEAKPSSASIYLDGSIVTLTAYNIDGSNYFKLRDIAKIFDIGVTWNGKTNTIGIDTSISYIE